MTSGAQHLLTGLRDAGIEFLFTNPGTTEIYFVAALGREAAPRPILTLSEAVAAGAADGFARMTGKPAAILVHLGPGLANAIASLHNAKRAHSPVVVIVGDHSPAVAIQDPPLASDIEALAKTFSKAVLHATRDQHPRHTAALAGYLALEDVPGIVTLIVPSDISWSDFGPVSPLAKPPSPTATLPPSTLARAKGALDSTAGTTVIVGGNLLTSDPNETLWRLMSRANLRTWANTFPARIDRGGTRPPIHRLPYLPEMAMAVLEDTRHIIVIGASPPVPFFAYPHLPDRLIPAGCDVLTVTSSPLEARRSAEALIAEWVPPPESDKNPPSGKEPSPGDLAEPLNTTNFASTVAALLPPEAIVVDESNTLGVGLEEATLTGPAHTWLPALTGGAIGHGLGLAIGAALAAPDRQVLAFVADGSSLYSPQAIWTHAAEQLKIITVILVNRGYGILRFELDRLGPEAPSQAAERLLSFDNPPIHHAQLAGAFAVPATTVRTAVGFNEALTQALQSGGPYLIVAEFPT
ncbi:acetolactate synthase large subunit [Ferrimicrobium sp.]|uniref:acetolactate synthase large subunit n=1 Tax=Ferrimicrobium sp. TaxID=2926050 RepID=UPI00261DB900|nr:acetolactate synthase large subunit [Ferrimicrobium sp.]